MSFMEDMEIARHIHELLLISKRTYTSALNEISIKESHMISATLREMLNEIESHQLNFTASKK